MSIFFENEPRHGDLLQMLIDNTVNSPEVYDEVYAAIVKNEYYVLYGDYPKELKIKVVESLIEYFIKTDEFEKCQFLDKIKNRI